MERKICVVTGSRADYGLLYWLMKEIQEDTELVLQIVVTGMHLSPEFGLTYQQIEDDGFKIEAKVEMLLSSDTSIGTAKSVGLGVIGFADVLNNLKPEILVVLGDRFEILAAVQAAIVMPMVIAHIHGGETTVGAFDESIRHAITKMSNFHFVASEVYRKRVIQLGEKPDRVFNFGAPGLDFVKKLEWIDRDSLEELLGIKLKRPVFLVTYHPVTLDSQSTATRINELLMALDAFPEAKVIFTNPNADTYGRFLTEVINEWANNNHHRAKAFVSLGQKRYLSLMREVDVVIGNSSSGIIEAPVLKRPTVNIGDRQKGRLKASSVIDSKEKKTNIVTAIKHALADDIGNSLSKTKSLYGYGEVSVKIKDTLKSAEISLCKTFFDIEHDY